MTDQAGSHKSGVWGAWVGCAALAMVVCIALIGGCASSDESTTTTRAIAQTTSTTVPLPQPEATTVEELLSLDRPIVLAHASGENEHPHSSLFGYTEAVRGGVDAIDLDVQLSSDDVLVVHHDATVGRTAEVEGDVADLTYPELFALDNAYWFTKSCTCRDQPDSDYLYRGVRTGEVEPPDGYTTDDFAIARFRDVAARFPNHVLNIEIKGKHPEALGAAAALADELTALDRLDAAVVTSFDDKIVDAFAEMAPSVALTPGLGQSGDYVLTNKAIPQRRKILQLPKSYEGIEVVTADFMQRVHRDGLVLWVWPNERELENDEAYEEFLRVGVDGINAAAPSEAVAALTQYLEDTN